VAQITSGSGYVGGDGSKLIPQYWADFMRVNLFPTCHFRQFGTKVLIPRGHGSSVKIPRWKNIFAISGGSAVLSAGRQMTAVKEGLTEGNVWTDACAKALCAESICGSTSQFGGVRAYTDKVILVSHANIIQGALESLLREMAFRLDRYTRIQLSAGTIATVKYAELPTTTKGTKVALIGSNIARIAPYMGASMTPSWPDGLWPMLTHPLAMWDTMTDTSASGFVTIARYHDQGMIYRGEVGQMYGVRFILTNVLPVQVGTLATSATVALSNTVTGVNSYIFAPDPFYSLELAEGGLEVIHHPPGSGGATGDQLNQYGSVGVKLHYGIITQPLADRRVIRYAHKIGLRY